MNASRSPVALGPAIPVTLPLPAGHVASVRRDDTGTHDSLSEASTYIEVLEKRQGLKVACLEGIAYTQGWITEERMRELAQPMLKNQYGQYLLYVIDEMKNSAFSNLD